MDPEDKDFIKVLLFCFVILISMCWLLNDYEYEMAKKYFPNMTKTEYFYLKPKIIVTPE